MRSVLTLAAAFMASVSGFSPGSSFYGSRPAFGLTQSSSVLSMAMERTYIMVR